MTSRRILIVDDEQALLRLISICMKRSGHESVCCGSAAEVRLLDGSGWDAAIVDLGLPDTEGPSLILELLDHHPHIRVLASSGSPFDLDAIPGHYRSRVAFLAKPYLPQNLIEALDALLAA